MPRATLTDQTDYAGELRTLFGPVATAFEEFARGHQDVTTQYVEAEQPWSAPHYEAQWALDVGWTCTAYCNWMGETSFYLHAICADPHGAVGRIDHTVPAAEEGLVIAGIRTALEDTSSWADRLAVENAPRQRVDTVPATRPALRRAS
jgi:hypothetical protein